MLALNLAQLHALFPGRQFGQAHSVTDLQLRLHVPARQVARVRRALATKTAQSMTAFKELGELEQAKPPISRSIRRHGKGCVVEVSIVPRRPDAALAPEFDDELVFRWVSGPTEGLLNLAGKWVDRYGLWLDDDGSDITPPAPRPRLRRGQSPDAALRCMISHGLERVLPNLAAIAKDQGKPEHLHQLRIGLRCVRSALREFADWSIDLDRAWEASLATLSGRLSRARDRDALDSTLMPQLRAAGGPAISLIDAVAAEPPAAVLRCAATTRLLLALIVYARSEPLNDGKATASLKALVDASIRRQHHHLRRDALRFMSVDDAARHRVRKRLKRLRYCVELCGAFYRDKASRRYLALLRDAQEALGRYTDLVMAQTFYRAHAELDARAWFAVGWLSARREPLLQAAKQALEALEAAPRLRQA